MYSYRFNVSRIRGHVLESSLRPGLARVVTCWQWRHLPRRAVGQVSEIDRQPHAPRAVEMTQHAIYRLEQVEHIAVLVEYLADERRAGAHVRRDDHLASIYTER